MKSLNLSTINQNILKTHYAVRGEVPIRATQLKKVKTRKKSNCQNQDNFTFFLGTGRRENVAIQKDYPV